MRKKQPVLYLASQSSRRRQILKQLGIRFRVVSSSYHERHVLDCDPCEMTLRHARGKVRRARLPRGARFVLGADTIVWLRKKNLGKPKTEIEAFEMLSFISGKRHIVYTAVVLKDLVKKRELKAVSKTKVWIQNLSDGKKREYLRRIHPFDKAGAYAIQLGPRIVKKIEGSYSNVMGLPREIVKDMFLEATGVKL